MQTTQNREKPLISFIVTYYNEPVSMLRECLDSILAINIDDDEREVIVIDDGSDISPLNELGSLPDKILYIRQPNRGLSEARNAGIDIAKGQYIQFVDADDYLLTDAYNLCVDKIRAQRPDVVMFDFTKEEGNHDSPNLFNGPVTGSEYMHNNNLRACAWGYIFRKDLIINLRFTPCLLHEDEEFTPQLILKAETMYYTDNYAYFYRERQDSIVHKNDAEWIQKRLNDAEHVILTLNHLAATLPFSERKALQRRVAQLTMDYTYNVMILTHSESQLEERMERLRSFGLFPLPKRDYTVKYELFRRMTASKLGRKILLRTVPLIKREK